MLNTVETIPVNSLIRWPVVRQMTGLSRSTIDRLEHRGEFPRRLLISSHAVAWRHGDVLAWAESRQTRPVPDCSFQN